MSSLQQALERHAAERPDEVALDADGVSWTWAELAVRVAVQAEAWEQGDGVRVQAPMSPPEIGVVYAVELVSTRSSRRGRYRASPDLVRAGFEELGRFSARLADESLELDLVVMRLAVR